MKGFAIHNAPTDHGGIIPATQMRSSQMGNLFVVAGDGHFCPKCKCWSKVLKSHDHVLFDGKAVAYAGDKLSCGARILPQQSHVVGDSGGGNYRSITPVSQPIKQQDLNNSLVGKENQSTRVNNIAYYKWWWGELESTKLETVAQEKRTFSENFDAMHKQYAYGTEAIIYEIDPKAWDVEIAMEQLPEMIQRSVDKNWDIATALSKISSGQTIDFVWKGLGFGGDYFRTIASKEWPLGRLAGVAHGNLTNLGIDAMGKPNFQFVGYVQFDGDKYSWVEDNGVINNIGIKVMAEAVKVATGKKTAAKVYDKKDNYGLPTIYKRKFHFDYKKDGTKTPLLMR